MEKKVPGVPSQTFVGGVSPQSGRGTILVISAPSGAGKSTLVRRLMASLPDLAFSVSYTTRPRREGEKEGRDYFFVTRRRFERMIAAGDFIEWAEVFGHLYGTSKAQLDKALASRGLVTRVASCSGVTLTYAS